MLNAAVRKGIDQMRTSAGRGRVVGKGILRTSSMIFFSQNWLFFQINLLFSIYSAEFSDDKLCRLYYIYVYNRGGD